MRRRTWRQRLSAACAAHARLGPASLVLYDVSTLYFETDRGDGFREPGFSKERRLEPQITIGLLTGQDRFPLMVSAIEGNKVETKTMLPVIEKFRSLTAAASRTSASRACRVRRNVDSHGTTPVTPSAPPGVPVCVGGPFGDRGERPGTGQHHAQR